MSKTKNKTHEITLGKTVVVMTIVIFLALFVEITALIHIDESSSQKTRELLAQQVATILENNRIDEEEMLESLKAEYMVRAKAVAHYLAFDETIEDDPEELVKIANLLEIDEIHIFDSTGTIIKGTEPKYYGYSFDSGEQMAYFKPMLEDKTLSMCQDVTPNTAENKEIMYAITWNEDGTEMVQVGITPTRLLEQLSAHDIEEVVSDMPGYQGHEIYVAENSTGEILGATDKNAIGEKIDDVKTDKNYECSAGGDYTVLITYTSSRDFQVNVFVVLITLLYLIIAAIIIFFTFRKLIAINKDNKYQLDVLTSMADVYYSMHLINLKDDTVVEYKAQNEVKEIANHKHGAGQMMMSIMKTVVKENYLNYALEFTDLKTLPERMKGKKIITGEFIGNRIGWSQVSFITIKADENGYPTDVMFVSRSIEEEKEKEEALIKSSNTDDLTQLLNRRAYETEMNSDSICYENLVYVAFDINGLKRTNDMMGHAAGDELIIGAATCIRKAFEGYGDVFRTGGDEFIAIIHASAEELTSAKRTFEMVVSQWTGKLVNKLSVSAGYVVFDDKECKNIKEMSVIADKKMYEDKAAYYKRSGVDRRKH